MVDHVRARHPTVLIVDDEQAVRAISRRVLERAGFSVVEATDGAQALVCLSQGVADAVVTDIRMPGMDGWELATHLAAMTPRPPVLFTSGYDVHLGSTNLPGPVLAKPFRPQQLVDSVRQLLLSRLPGSA